MTRTGPGACRRQRLVSAFSSRDSNGVAVLQFDLITNLDRGQYLPVLELGIDHVVMQAFQRGVTFLSLMAMMSARIEKPGFASDWLSNRFGRVIIGFRQHPRRIAFPDGDSLCPW